MGYPREGAVEYEEMALQRGVAVNVEWRACRRGNPVNGDILCMENAVNVSEIMHIGSFSLSQMCDEGYSILH